LELVGKNFYNMFVSNHIPLIGAFKFTNEYDMERAVKYKLSSLSNLNNDLNNEGSTSEIQTFLEKLERSNIF